MEVVAQFIPLVIMLGIGWFFVVQARKRRDASPSIESDNFFSSIHYGVYVVVGAIAVFVGTVVMPEVAIELLQKVRSSDDIRMAREVDRFAPAVAIIGGLICALGVIKAILKK